jgi:hypothetical protein
VQPAVCSGGKPVGVGHDDHSYIPLGAGFVQQVVEFLGAFAVQVSRRFIRQDDLGLVD